jgi:uncharacterized protein
MIAPSALSILCCPETHQPVTPADAELVAKLNARIRAGQLTNRAGKKIAEPMEEGLIRQDRQILYPVRNNIPVMLVDEGIRIAEV